MKQEKRTVCRAKIVQSVLIYQIFNSKFHSHGNFVTYAN